MPIVKLIAFNLDEAYLQKIEAEKTTTYRISADKLRESEEKMNAVLSQFCRDENILLNSPRANNMKKTLEAHLAYRPTEVRHFSEKEVQYGLPQAGLLPSKKEFSSEEEAIRRLRFFWAVARRNPETVVRIERRVRANAETSIDSWINKIFSA